MDDFTVRGEGRTEELPEDITGAAGFGDFGEHPLGRRVIGDAGVISSISSADVAAYHRDHYVGSGIVISAVGNLEHDAIVSLAAEHVRPPKQMWYCSVSLGWKRSTWAFPSGAAAATGDGAPVAGKALSTSCTMASWSRFPAAATTMLPGT
jgi:hypothetical protein